MSNRYAILIESYNVYGQHLIPGAKLDVEHLRSFLTSNLGGAWESNEIIDLHKPQKGEVKDLLCEHEGAYIFLAFSGHGYEAVSSSGEHTPKICLNEAEQDVSVDEIRPLRFGTAIFDSCRGLEYTGRFALANESVAMDSAEFCINKAGAADYLIHRRVACRELFNQDLQRKATKAAVRMFSCSSNESAGESATAGGYYTTFLLASAAEWERRASCPNIYSTLDAHFDACKKMYARHPQQHPQYAPTWQAYPFAVNV